MYNRDEFLMMEDNLETQQREELPKIRVECKIFNDAENYECWRIEKRYKTLMFRITANNDGNNVAPAHFYV